MDKLRFLARDFNRKDKEVHEEFTVHNDNKPYLDYLDSLDPPSNKIILDKFIEQHLGRWKFMRLKSTNCSKNDLFVKSVLNPINRIVNQLLDLGYCFVPRGIRQYYMLSRFPTTILLLAGHGQISAEYVCWFLANNLNYQRHPFLNEDIISESIKFPELQPIHLQALYDFAIEQKYYVVASKIKNYLYDVDISRYGVWHLGVRDNPMRDDNIFIQIIIEML